LNQILRRQTSRSHYGSKIPAVTVTVFKYRNKIGTGTILGQAYKYGGVKSINGIPTLLSSVLNVRGLKIEILHVELLCFVVKVRYEYSFCLF
jgi:hypothetical protein